MKFGRGKIGSSHRSRWGVVTSLALGFSAIASARPRIAPARSPWQINSQATRPSNAEAELQTGIELTKQGHFTEAIPHFLAAQGHVRDEYAANFNLALCYVAIGQPARAIEILRSLKSAGKATAGVDSLLAQAYIGASQEKLAWEAFEQAMAQAPDDEKLYLFLADASMEHQSYDLGLQILSAGLKHLPRSALIHYERGVFFTYENQPDSAESEFHNAEKLAPKSDTYYMAAGQAALLEGNIPEVIRVTQEGIHAGYQSYILLALFGRAVVDSGAAPGQPLFAQAESALHQAVTRRPANAGTHIALARLYLRANHVDDAVAHLELARNLAPDDPSVYSHLAVAYRRRGELAKSQAMLAILAKLDAAQAAKYKTSSPNKAGYVASGRAPRKPYPEQ
jgi:predicted Zn-dependent protease